MQMLMTNMVSDKTKEVDVDVERALNDVHLHNDTIDSLYWDNVLVKVNDTKRHHHKHLLDSIDGSASAGQSKMIADHSPSHPRSVSDVRRD